LQERASGSLPAAPEYSEHYARTPPVGVLGPAYEDAVDNLRTFIAQLRRKVERDPARPQRIVTEPGLGYRFRSEPATSTRDE